MSRRRRDFEWDAEKAELNLAKHGIGFEEAAEAFTDPRVGRLCGRAASRTPRHLAMSPRERILYVVTVERAWQTRIISARRATSHERRIYEAE